MLQHRVATVSLYLVELNMVAPNMVAPNMVAPTRRKLSSHDAGVGDAA